MSSQMTYEEREIFLADIHVGVLGIASPNRGPVLVPVWYSYEPGGEIAFLTDKDSRKVELLTQEGRFTLCVQNEEPPYQYVSVEGPVTLIEEADRARDLGPIARRYLGKTAGDAYVEDTKGVEEVLVKMRPERWSTADYGKTS
jgi:PPOX class probable F420-dependent enzyme